MFLVESKAEHIVQNIGAIAETVAVFYNSISKQVSKDVALVLTRHFMDLTINRRPLNAAVINGNVATAIAAVQEAEAKRKAMERKKREEQKNEQKVTEEEKPTEEAENRE